MTTDSTTVPLPVNGSIDGESDSIRSLNANIPVRNWFYMLLYAWDLGALCGDMDALADDAPDLRALLTRILVHYTKRQIRRGLRGDYVDLSEPLRTVRGRINIGRTVSDLLLYKGQLHCDYQEYSLNVPRNQIIVSTLNRQLRYDYARIERDSHGMLTELKADLETLVRSMSEIDRVHLSDRMIATEMRKLGRNEREYRLIMLICEWLNRPRLPSANSQGQRFTDIQDLIEWRVYEKFVANWMRLHCEDWRVETQPRFEWNETCEDSSSEVVLPGMAPDIVLTNKESGQRVVIDTKWYSSAVSHYYGRETVHNNNLYQMWSYLSSQDSRGPEWRRATGILFYAQTVEGARRLRKRIDAHPFRVHTLDLSRRWQVIECYLRGLIGTINVDRQDLQD